jgi:choice-of-anchor A domain-containing protein
MNSPLPPGGGLRILPLLAFACTVGIASAQNLSSLSEYNVIVSGNLSTNSEIEGRTIVGGNITSSSSANFGIKLQNKVPKGDLVLRVGGDIAAGNPIQLNAGSLELGGSRNNRIINYNGGGSLVQNPGADFSGIISDLTAASQVLATYGANSNAMIFANMPGQPGPLRFTATPDSNGLAVFSVNGSDVFGNGNAQRLEIVTNNAADILINVAGTAINWNSGDMVGAFDEDHWQSRIVWNFYEATSINFGGKEFGGQILAPNANITTNGVIEGSVFAKNLTTQSEVHLPGYGGNLVPEPSSALLVFIGATGMLLRRRRSD